MSSKTPIYVIQHNHFDPIWRRCWDRTFDYKGKRYRSYADLEEYFINIWLENAKQGIPFSEGQAVVFRKYLERNPDRLEEMRNLVRRGIIELTAAGETVADTNMPSGETLLRNLVTGQRYFEDTFGVIPSIGWLQDAFGQSAQMPQLFRGVECKHVAKLSYKQVPGIYWKGLDGTVIRIGEAPEADRAGGQGKIPPCPECEGVGCALCEWRGLADRGYVTDEHLREILSQNRDRVPFAVVDVGDEESIPNPRIKEILEQVREETGNDLRFGTYQVVSDFYADDIAKVDDPDIEVSDQVEANPVSTGCYVTRIEIKQNFRRVENLVNTAERWATVAHLLGADYPAESLTEAWRNLLFCAFHDAITSTHIDSAYFELLDMLAEAECEAEQVLDLSLDYIESNMHRDPEKDYLVVYNSESWERSDPVTITLAGTRGVPCLRYADGDVLDVLDVSAEGLNVNVTFRPTNVPPLGSAAVEIDYDAEPIHSGDVTSGPGEIENEFFKIKVSDRGIESIFDKRISKEILDTSKYLGNELILEEDIGHPWGTMQMPSFQEGLGQYTTGVKIRRAEKTSEIVLTGQYKGKDENAKILTWRQSVKLYKDVDRIDFHTQIDWDTAQRRIRVAFPTNIKTDEGVYAIPYGALKRGKYEPDMSQMPSTNGDWPAINWVDVYSEEENRGVALINTGAPSHKVEDGVIFMSVLRSPTDSWCLNEPEFYDCPDFDGARDAGFHEFLYSLIPHQGDYADAHIERRGREVNNPMIVRPLMYDNDGEYPVEYAFMKIDATDNVIVTAIKKADRDDSVIVRLAETDGKPGEASVALENAGTKASLVNFLERHPQPASDKIKLGPFRIVTVRLSK